MRKLLVSIVASALLVGVLTVASGPASAVGFGTVTGFAYDVDGFTPLSGVQVDLFPEDDVFGTPVASGLTGADGSYELLNVPAGIWVAAFTFADASIECFDTTFGGGSAAACEEGNQAVVNVIDGVLTSGINIVKDLPDPIAACDPLGTSPGLTNMGFETGDFTSWTQGPVFDTVGVTMADTFTSPYEGTYMARLGSTYPSSDEDQPEGPNAICQSFVVDQPVESFVYNIFTYDYTGFDEFEFDVHVTSPATGERLATLTQGAWGSGTALKTSGWRGVEINLAGHLGETVQITFSAGGTSDSLFGFWAYLDSADSGLPPETVTLADVDSTSGSVMVDPFTGQVTIAQPFSSPSDITLSTTVTCPTEGEVPSGVNLLLNGTSFPMTETPPGSGVWTATIPSSSVAEGVLSVQANCPGGTLVNVIGSIDLYDPSGYLTDAITGEPIEGAEVTLYKVPGWTAMESPSDTGAMKCQSNLSKPAEEPWSQPAPTDQGVVANPVGGEIDPQVNPFISNSEGYYGWDVAAGCWYVVVEAEGYETLTSPVVGVPPEVTDLDLELWRTDLPEFSDVPEGSTFWEDVMWMAIYEITTGFDDGTFRPGGSVTRGSMAAFLYRFDDVFNAPVPVPVSVRMACASGPAFPDVPQNHPFCAEIEWMVDEGITTGYGDGTYKPGEKVTRGSMAAFLYRMAGSPLGADPACTEAAFPDVPQGHVFCGEITWMVEAEITGGFGDGTFKPGMAVSRGQMSAFLHRFHDAA